MLHLNRKVGQKVFIETPEGTVEVTVLEIEHPRSHAPRVLLGLSAPRQIPIDREEVRQSKEEAGNGGV